MYINNLGHMTKMAAMPTIIFKHVYWYMQLISGERLQDHWSSGYIIDPVHEKTNNLGSNQVRQTGLCSH